MIRKLERNEKNREENKEKILRSMERKDGEKMLKVA